MNEKQLLAEFQVEELEKRFEMRQWVDSVKVGAQYENVEVHVVVPV